MVRWDGRSAILGPMVTQGPYFLSKAVLDDSHQYGYYELYLDDDADLSRLMGRMRRPDGALAKALTRGQVFVIRHERPGDAVGRGVVVATARVVVAQRKKLVACIGGDGSQRNITAAETDIGWVPLAALGITSPHALYGGVFLASYDRAEDWYGVWRRSLVIEDDMIQLAIRAKVSESAIVLATADVIDSLVEACRSGWPDGEPDDALRGAEREELLRLAAESLALARSWAVGTVTRDDLRGVSGRLRSLHPNSPRRSGQIDPLLLALRRLTEGVLVPCLLGEYVGAVRIASLQLADSSAVTAKIRGRIPLEEVFFCMMVGNVGKMRPIRAADIMPKVN